MISLLLDAVLLLVFRYINKSVFIAIPTLTNVGVSLLYLIEFSILLGFHFCVYYLILTDNDD